MRVAMAALAAAGALLCLAPRIARALDNEQTVVLGFTVLGFHSFDDTDAVREQANLDAPHLAFVEHLYAEWYLAGNLGIGGQYLHVERAAIGGHGAAGRSVLIELTSLLFTMQYVAAVSEDGYERLGLVLGAGPARYTSRRSYASFPKKVASTHGIAARAQGYLDWGGDDFGARFGVGYLATRLDAMQGDSPPPLESDAGGWQLYLDLRWAFK